MRELGALIDDHRVVMLGAIRQELLSGISSKHTFDMLRRALRAYPDQPIETEDHENAAEFYNKCRSKGVQGSFIDFLIAAVAWRGEFSVYTQDKDFDRYSRILPLILHIPSAR